MEYNPVLVILGDISFQDGKAIVNKVDYVLYMDADGERPDLVDGERDQYIDSAEKICKCAIENGHINAFVIPSMYSGEIILPEGFELPPEYPEDFDWDFIEENLPDYDHCDDVLCSDILGRYVDKGQEDPDESDIEWILEGKPDFLMNHEWAYHQMCEVDTMLFLEAEENS